MRGSWPARDRRPPEAGCTGALQAARRARCWTFLPAAKAAAMLRRSLSPRSVSSSRCPARSSARSDASSAAACCLDPCSAASRPSRRARSAPACSVRRRSSQVARSACWSASALLRSCRSSAASAPTRAPCSRRACACVCRSSCPARLDLARTAWRSRRPSSPRARSALSSSARWASTATSPPRARATSKSLSATSCT